LGDCQFFAASATTPKLSSSRCPHAWHRGLRGHPGQNNAKNVTERRSWGHCEKILYVFLFRIRRNPTYWIPKI